jgi:hypothetical protein
VFLNEIELLKLDNFFRIVHKRQDFNGKPMHDMEDIMLAMTFLEEHNLIKDLPTYTVINPEKRPLARLCEGICRLFGRS